MRNLVGLAVPKNIDAEWRAAQEARLKEVAQQLESQRPDPKVNEEAYEYVKQGQANDMVALAERYKAMAPPGALRLEVIWGKDEARLLEAARFKYAIPDGCFTSIAEYDWVHVFCIPEFDEQKLNPGTHIERTASQEDASWVASSRGIIVSAGLKALDQLRSHGMGVGYTVGCVRPTPYRDKADIVQARPQWLTLYRAGDLHKSETTLAMILAGELKIEYVEGVGHCYRRPGEDPVVPVEPFAAEDQ